MENKQIKTAKVSELIQELEERGDRISKAKRVRSLLQKQKAFMGDKQSLTDFKEPVLDLHRRDGKIETYEEATAGKFVFTHSTGRPRFIELRPSDQETRDYAGRKIRWYSAHEDRPFAGWDEPVVDGESVMLGYEKTKATDLKYESKLQELKNAGRLTWVWIILGIAGALAIIAFAYNSWIGPMLLQQAREKATETAGAVVPPTIGLFLARIRKRNNVSNV